MVISIVVRYYGMISKSLEKRLRELEIRGRIKAIQTMVLLKSARILRRVLMAGGNLLSLKLQ